MSIYLTQPDTGKIQKWLTTHEAWTMFPVIWDASSIENKPCKVENIWKHKSKALGITLQENK